MRMTTNIKDFKKILVKFSNLPKKINNNVIDALVTSASELRNEMITSMNDSPPIGNSYRIAGKTHIASAPGYPPRKMNSHLVNSFEMDINEINGTVEIGSTMKDPDYPKFLENGVGDPASVYYIAARPFMKPALEKKESEMEKRILDAIKQSVE